MRKIILLIMLLTSPVIAQEVSQERTSEPDEARKIWALKRAYERNGNSMVRELHLGSIDLSQENPPVIADPNEVNALDTAATPPASTRSRRRRDK